VSECFLLVPSYTSRPRKGTLTTTTTTVLQPFFRDQPGEPVSEENFWTLWCKGRLTEADTPTIRMGATPAVEHWSLADVLSLSCARLVADG